MISLKTLRADVSQEMSYVYEKVKQYDNLSRKYKVLITDKGNMVSLKGNEAIRIRMWADGESTPYVDKYLDEPWEDGYPILIMTSNMLSKIGKVKYEFVIQEPGSAAVISTRQQNLSIQQSLIDYDGIISSEDFDVLSHLISQALTIPDLIENIDIRQDELEQLIIQIQTDMSNYQTEFTEMQTNVNEMIQSVNNYISELTENVNITLNQANTALSTANQLIAKADNTLEQAVQKADESSASALLAKKAEDNSEQYYNETKNLKEQVDAASKLVIPRFYIDMETMDFMSDTEAKGIRLWYEDGVFYGEEITE
ncbi:hypothetical protein [Clostridium sp. HBUAS56010]|uniref:hypothetical protein n=1 Tax=Clostridium sp. HBUAS56010 TaxID=2571127 RepID=UPI001178875E|nr:hypothetical protein [Clostridium sp. HBUAS56010]